MQKLTVVGVFAALAAAGATETNPVDSVAPQFRAAFPVDAEHLRGRHQGFPGSIPSGRLNIFCSAGLCRVTGAVPQNH